MENTETTEENPVPENTTRDRVKAIANLAVGMSVTSVVKTVIAQNVIPKNKFQSVELFIAAYALGGLLAKHSTAYTDERIDKAADMIQKFRDGATVSVVVATPEPAK